MDRYFDVIALVSNGRFETVEWSARHYPQTPHLLDLSDALTLPFVDAVFFATPTRTHAALTCEALQAGCHVFVEKPLSLEPDGAIRAVTMAERYGLEVFVGYVYLFHPGFRFLSSVASPESIRSLRFEWVRPQLSGSLHGELLCHDLAVTIALTGELPKRVVVIDSCNRFLRCRIELPSGRLCESTMELRQDMLKRKTLTVIYEDGMTYKWHDDQVFSVDDPVVGLLNQEGEDPLSREISAFRSAIEGHRPRMVDDRRFSIGIARLLSHLEDNVGT